MNLFDIQDILKNVSYKTWEFDVHKEHDGPSADILLQVRFLAEGNRWAGRKWRLSRYMTTSEIVQTALKAVLTAEEHEARERFAYKGVAVFGPRIDVEALVEAAKKQEVRK